MVEFEIYVACVFACQAAVENRLSALWIELFAAKIPSIGFSLEFADVTREKGGRWKNSREVLVADFIFRSWLRVVKEGLKAGEQVIVEGLSRVRPGVVVDPKFPEAK